MPILTPVQYNNLWTLPAPYGFGQSLTIIPNYDYYLIREHMFEDYLDLFRGVDTRAVRLAANPVIMPYNHPFLHTLQQIGNKEFAKPCIKYILIAEAAPPVDPRILNAAFLDKNNSYFYSTIDIGATGYFEAPVTAFGIPTALTKTEKLIELAKAGVILVDIFPYAIVYKRFRDELIANGTLLDFWNGVANPYSLNLRINNLYPFFCPNTQPNAALIAPPKISHYLAYNMNAGIYPMIPGIGFRLTLNQFGPIGGPLLAGIPAASPSHAAYFYTWPAGQFLNGTIQPLLTIAPNYQCCAYGGSMTVPHPTFIENALL